MPLRRPLRSTLTVIRRYRQPRQIIGSLWLPIYVPKHSCISLDFWDIDKIMFFRPQGRFVNFYDDHVTSGFDFSHWVSDLTVLLELLFGKLGHFSISCLSRRILLTQLISFVPLGAWCTFLCSIFCTSSQLVGHSYRETDGRTRTSLNAPHLGGGAYKKASIRWQDSARRQFQSGRDLGDLGL